MLRTWTTFYITIFTFSILLRPILSHPAPPGLVEQDKSEGSKRTSYSGYFMESIMTPEDAARLGFDDMKKQHKGKGAKTEPSVMSSLQKEKEMFLASSVKGGLGSSDNKDPEHVHPNVQKHLNKCEKHHGGKHGTGANCGEVHAASNFFRKNPSQEHIEGATFVAYGHPGGKKSNAPDFVPPCTGSGRHKWGCAQFVKSVTRPLDRPLTPLDRPLSPVPGAEGVGNVSPGPSSPKKGDTPLKQKPPPLRTGAGQSPLSALSNTGKAGSSQPAPPGRPSAPPKQRPGSESPQLQEQKKRPGPLAPLQPSLPRPNSPSKDRLATMQKLKEPIPNTKPSGPGSPSLRSQSNPKERPATPPSPKKQESLAPLPAHSFKLTFPGTSKEKPASPGGSGTKTASSPPKDHPLPPPPPPSSPPPKKADQNQNQKQATPPPPQQKAKAPASAPPAAKAQAPPRQQKNPAPPPIPKPANSSPPPSARPASSGGQGQSAARGGKGKKGKRSVEVLRRVLRREVLRREVLRREVLRREVLRRELVRRARTFGLTREGEGMGLL
ncbi:hypothetical protein MMC30_004309 [Trapelia coarctata]|nr:hypothetical protein [Trapelia coarctata]